VSRGEIGDKFGDHNFAIATPKIGDQDLAGAGSEGAATAWIMSARKTIAATVSVLLPRSAVAANITGTSTRRYIAAVQPDKTTLARQRAKSKGTATATTASDDRQRVAGDDTKLPPPQPPARSPPAPPTAICRTSSAQSGRNRRRFRS